MKTIDLNSDMGESFGAYRMGMDEAVIQHITSANIACGWHAGDPMVMDKTVKMAASHGVGAGAHPGYPDLLGRTADLLLHKPVIQTLRTTPGSGLGPREVHRLFLLGSRPA